MRRFLVLELAAPLLVVVPAAAAVIDRVRIAEAGGAVTRSFPPSVFVSVTSPGDYVRASSSSSGGRWLGPRYQATGNGSLGGETSIAWHLRFTSGQKDAEAAAETVAHRGWPVDIKGGVSVPHVVAGRTVGTILGHYVLRRAPGAKSAAFDAAFAFPVASRLYALLRFELLEPATDDAGDQGRYVVKGSLPASIWNRGQAFWALTAVRLEGNLAPTRVAARVAPNGQAVRGTVADAFRHPIIGARVVLERETGAGWTRVASARTNSRGAYSVRGISRPGRYRAVAAVGRAVARSVSFFAG